MNRIDDAKPRAELGGRTPREAIAFVLTWRRTQLRIAARDGDHVLAGQLAVRIAELEALLDVDRRCLS